MQNTSNNHFSSSEQIAAYFAAHPGLTEVSIDGSDAGVSQIPSLPPTATSIRVCYSMGLATPPVWHEGLTSITIVYAPHLQDIGILPSTLKELIIVGVPLLRQLPTLPNLTKLVLGVMRRLSSFPGLPDTLVDLMLVDLGQIDNSFGIQDSVVLPSSIQNLKIINCPGVASRGLIIGNRSIVVQ